MKNLMKNNKIHQMLSKYEKIKILPPCKHAIVVVFPASSSPIMTSLTSLKWEC